MRDYGKVAATFWTGRTGRLMRDNRDAQVVALYLLTGPLANMIGLYHLPVSLIADHTGMKLEGASKALRRVCDTGFARFEGGLEHVFIPEMAAYQIGEPLDNKDNRVKGIITLWQSFRKSSFYMEFHARYKDSFHLPEPSPLQAPCKPLRSQEQEQEQELYQEQEVEDPPTPEAGELDSAGKSKKKSRPRSDAEACPLFARFWSDYPRKVKRPAAARAFAKHSPSEELLAKMLGAVERQRRSDQWIKEAGAFIPYPATWLNNREWENLPPEVGTNGVYVPQIHKPSGLADNPPDFAPMPPVTPKAKV